MYFLMQLMERPPMQWMIRVVVELQHSTARLIVGPLIATRPILDS